MNSYVSIGAMNLNAIETSLHSVQSCLSVVFHKVINISFAHDSELIRDFSRDIIVLEEWL